MIAIIAAMSEELAAIQDAVAAAGPVQIREIVGQRIQQGHLAGRPVLLAQSGIGKVAAAATATVLAGLSDQVIMVGTAGGLGPRVCSGDLVVGAELLQHDLDVRPLWGRWVVPWLGQARIPTDPKLTAALSRAASVVVESHRGELARQGFPEPGWHTGLLISGDRFVSTTAEAKRLQTELPEALAVDMESAAVAQVCHQAGVRFAVARTISDRADEAAGIDFPRFLTQVAAPYARELVVNALQALED